MQIPLRRAQILVARQFLCDDRIACVLGGPRAELVAQRVPDEALIATPLQPRELEQFPSHDAEVAPIFGSEHVRLWITPKREPALLQSGL